MPQHFWLIRHALVHASALARLYGTDDVPICGSTMESQADRYVALANRLPRPARMICTPLSRTQLTAAAIIRAGYPAQAPVIDAAFVEQDFGDYQGMPIAGFDARGSDTRHPFWPIHAAETPPGGESFDAMIARVGAGLDRLRDQSEANTIIISHGGAIRAAIAHALELNAHQALCLAIDNISLTRLEHNGRNWRVLSINEHLSTSACETSPAASFAESPQ